MQGLENVIGLSVTHSTWQRTKPGTDDKHAGWAFRAPTDPPVTSPNGETSTLASNPTSELLQCGFLPPSQLHHYRYLPLWVLRHSAEVAHDHMQADLHFMLLYTGAVLELSLVLVYPRYVAGCGLFDCDSYDHCMHAGRKPDIHSQLEKVCMQALLGKWCDA